MADGKTEEEAEHNYVEVKNLPDFSTLNSRVKEVVNSSSWFDLYGTDWLQFTASALCLPVGLLVLRDGSLQAQVLGIMLLTVYHTSLTARAGHLASHGSLARSPSWNYFWHVLFGEFIGSFSTKCGHDIHIKSHHPHTNIIGLGDSSTWKAPFLSCYAYMFFGPLSLPALVPLTSLHLLVKGRDWTYLAVFLLLFPLGVALHVALLVHVSGFFVSGAFCALYVYRAGLSIPYIHVNIFQHIGLPMYSPKERPSRIYQMASGCLNLSANPILDFNFGHSLVSCHVEHHLFPKLSDGMCMKIKPIVKEFLVKNGLPYNEETYGSRLGEFLRQYDSLMVRAPPITHLIIALQ